MPDYLLDTNAILRWREPGTPMGDLAREAIAQLRLNQDTLYITPQNIVEFWSVASRPANVNGLGLSPDEVDREVQAVEQLFALLPDVPTIYPEWRRLVLQSGVSGRQVHDARLAAAMIVHGITCILTFNTGDFGRYPGITPVHPSEVLADSSA